VEVNLTNTNGIVQELRAQRNDALDKVAMANGRMAELSELLKSAQKEIADLKIEIKRLTEEPAAEAA
jgi:peptidoglycan hydrolase CwlO-like protein